MKISVLGSGSTGNAVLLVANGTRVLVDAGLTRVKLGADVMLGEDPNSLDGILVTTSTATMQVDARPYEGPRLPVFMSAKTRDAYVGEAP